MSKITYTQVGDYLLPNIALSETPDAELLGRYGRMRRAFLRENQKALYNQMLMTETLIPHLREIDKAAQARIDVISDPEVAHKIILAELVYA
jgi:hypothetical protein